MRKEHKVLKEIVKKIEIKLICIEWRPELSPESWYFVGTKSS